MQAGTGKVKSFYNYGRLLSYNATFNMAVGGRGIGKTYGAKKIVLKAAIKSGIEDGEQFILLRRYKEELSLAKNTFMADIQEQFPDYDFKSQGFSFMAAPAETRDDKKRKWHIIGYFISLSTAQSYKGVSFHRVTRIIFDEFILEKSATHYLPDEAKIFLNFFSTVDRYKDKTKVFFLANSVSIENPYFIEYEITPDKADENGFVKVGDGFMIVHFIDSDEFENEVYQTKFGRFIQQTDYAEYAVANKFSDNHKHLIGGKPSRAKYFLTLETKSYSMSIWYDAYEGIYYAQKKRPKVEDIFVLNPEQVTEDKILITFQDKTLGRLRTAFRHGRILFDIPATRNAFLETFKR